MKFPKSPSWLVELFGALQPEVGGEPRKMFGFPVAFENGQLFMGLFGDGVFLRLNDADRAELMKMKGAAVFAPMGRPSKTSVMLPPSMLEDEEAVKDWMTRALHHARTLPPKNPKAKKPAAKRASRKSG